MAISKDREYRNFAMMECREAGEGTFIVEGYASTYEPYCLFEEDGISYYEQIDPRAFDGADMNDVVFLYNHTGQVMARSKNGTLKLSADEHGLKIIADLSTSARAREMYDEIKAGLIDQMSFAFNVAEDSYDRVTHTRRITRMKKIFDASAVCYPANPTTEISARSWCDGVIDRVRAERLEAEKREAAKARIRIMSLRSQLHES